MSPLRLAVAPLAAAWALAGLAAGAPAALGATATDPTPTQAIAELNTWRAQVGEQPVSTTPVASWDTGCEQANAYDDDNQTLTHQEAQASPGYTTTGADAASNSVLAEGGSLRAPAEASLLPGPVWDSSVFHRAALLQPRFGQTGFDASTFHPSNYQSYECMWVQDDTTNNINAINDAVTTPGLALYPSPANGAYDVPTTFPGGESPDPAIETGVPAGSTLGWLLNVEINGPWSDGGNGGSVFASGVTAKLTADGTATTIPVVVSQCGSAGCFSPGGTSDGIYFGGGFGIFPTKPLKPSTTYRVQLTGGQVTDQPDSTSYPLAGFSWCFSTGSSYAPSADCARSSTGAAAEPGGTAAAPVAPGPPKLSHGSLSGVRTGRPTLFFDVSAQAGAPNLKTIAVSLPRGLSFASAKHVAAGLFVVTTANHTLKTSITLRRGTLTITLPGSGQAIVAVNLTRSALSADRALIAKAKGRHPAPITSTVTITSTGGATTRLRLSVTP